MLENFGSLSKDHKERFLKMCLLLFSSFKSAKFRDDGIIVFKPRRWFSKKVCISFMELLTFGVPRLISINKWGTYALVPEMYKKFTDTSKVTKDHVELYTIMSDYYYSLFEEIKIRDIYKSYNTVLVLNEVGKDTNNLEININNVYDRISLTTSRKAYLNSFINNLKVNAATIALFISLWLPAKAYMLPKLYMMGDNILNIKNGTQPWFLLHVT
jgi:hypothetical protein